MLSKFFGQLNLIALNIERNLFFLLKRHNFLDEFYPHNVEPLTIFDIQHTRPTTSLSMPNIEDDFTLWAVPKSRRSLEKRLSRKFGWPQQVWKPLVSKKNLLLCKTCGEHYEAGFLCSNCYLKVKSETEGLHAVIEREIGLTPNDKEVVILYEGERDGYSYEVLKGKSIVEVPKKRPQWFSKNLLERTTKGLDATSNVKPSDLA